MKHLVLALLIACGASSTPPADPAPAPAVTPAPAPAAPPAPALPPKSRVADPIGCSASDQAAVYCVHVKDACCSAEGWTCDNARYVEWFREYCGK